MWLQYGINRDGALVAIDSVRRGQTDLKCPYCGGFLTAKKGRIKEHHFAHIGETCRAVAGDRDINLPMYDRFNLHLSPKEFEALQKLYSGKTIDRKLRSRLKNRELIEWNDYKGRSGGYEFTKLGKIPVGALSLMLFNQVQEPLILDKHSDLVEDVEMAAARESVDLPDYLTDLRLYRVQLQRILSLTLYYLEVTGVGETLYKIGVTTRPVEERVVEIERDLSEYFQSVSIKVLGSWTHRGNVERYFMYRYKQYQHPIGSLQEYFKFDSPELAKSVLRDLRRMKPKVLTPDEVEIVEGKPSEIEVIIEAERSRQLHSAAVRTGMERARHWGTHVGRPIGSSISNEEYLAQPKSAEIISALSNGLSVRKTARTVGVSPNTVQKVKTIWLKHK
jgi:T5orf172 domain